MYLQRVSIRMPQYPGAVNTDRKVPILTGGPAAYTSLEDKMAYSVNVDNDKCNGDGECVDICPVSVYELQDGKSVPVNAEECLGCESCVEVCPTSAITIEEM